MKKKARKYADGGLTAGTESYDRQPTVFETPTITIEPPFSTQPVQAQPEQASNYAYAAQNDQGFQNNQSSLQNLGVTKMKRGGKVSSASKRADGIAQRGKTKGRYI